MLICVCLCAEGKRHRVYSAAHPMANTQSRSRASEDQSCSEKGWQFNTVTHTHPGVTVLCHIEINWVAHFKTKEFYVRER